MRLSQLACSELMDTSQSMLLLVRIRGYVSTSSYPALRRYMHEHMWTRLPSSGRWASIYLQVGARAERCDSVAFAMRACGWHWPGGTGKLEPREPAWDGADKT